MNKYFFLLMGIIWEAVVGRSTLVGQHPMKSLFPVCPLVCQSGRLRLSLSFLKIRLLVFSDIQHDGT